MLPGTPVNSTMKNSSLPTRSFPPLRRLQCSRNYTSSVFPIDRCTWRPMGQILQSSSSHPANAPLFRKEKNPLRYLWNKLLDVTHCSLRFRVEFLNSSGYFGESDGIPVRPGNLATKKKSEWGWMKCRWRFVNGDAEHIRSSPLTHVVKVG